MRKAIQEGVIYAPRLLIPFTKRPWGLMVSSGLVWDGAAAGAGGSQRLVAQHGTTEEVSGARLGEPRRPQMAWGLTLREGTWAKP